MPSALAALVHELREAGGVAVGVADVGAEDPGVAGPEPADAARGDDDRRDAAGASPRRPPRAASRVAALRVGGVEHGADHRDAGGAGGHQGRDAAPRSTPPMATAGTVGRGGEHRPEALARRWPRRRRALLAVAAMGPMPR